MHAAYAGSIHGCTWPSRNSVLPSNLNEVCSTRLRHSLVQSLYYTYIRWFFVTCALSYGLNPLLIALHYTLQTTPSFPSCVILRPHLASSNRPLRSFNRLDLIVPRSITALAQSRSFTSNVPTLWIALSPSVRSTFLTVSLSSSIAFLKTYLFSWGLAH